MKSKILSASKNITQSSLHVINMRTNRCILRTSKISECQPRPTLDVRDSQEQEVSDYIHIHIYIYANKMISFLTRHFVSVLFLPTKYIKIFLN